MLTACVHQRWAESLIFDSDSTPTPTSLTPTPKIFKYHTPTPLRLRTFQTLGNQCSDVKIKFHTRDVLHTDIFTTRTAHRPSHPTCNLPVTSGICQIFDSVRPVLVKIHLQKVIAECRRVSMAKTSCYRSQTGNKVI